MPNPCAPFFAYRDHSLHAEDLPLARVAAEVGTPCYVYSQAALETGYRSLAAAFAGQRVGIHYAVKANANQAVLRTFARLGAGADVVSWGEAFRALKAGIPAGRIVFSGVGKTAEELRAALTAGIWQLNVESLPELEAVSTIAAQLGVTAPVAFRINPDVDAGTHHKISTGRKENKFGIDYDHAGEAFTRAASLPGVEAVGITVHIGSQLTSAEPFRAAFARVADLVLSLRAAGHRVSRLDLGGGLGVTYRQEAPPSAADYAAVIAETVGGLDCELAIEPGRWLVANAGVLVARVIYLKEGLHRRFAIVDAAMNDLIRPALYESYHGIIPLAEPAHGAGRQPVDVVGPVCETGDTFALQRSLPPLAAGDLVAFLSAGAYGAVMSSTYNTRPLVPEVLVSGDRYAIIRPRPSLEDMLAAERVPAWL